MEEETKAPAATKPAAREALTVPAPSSDTPHLRPRPTEPTATPAPPPPPPAEVRREQEQAEDLAEERAASQSRQREAPAPAGPPSSYRTAPPAPAAAYQKQQENAELGQGANPSAPELLIGRVTNEGGEPIYNALVRLHGLPLGERTDTNGIFRLEVDAVASLIEVSHPNYEAEQLEFSDASENLQVSLEEKVEKDYREWTDDWAKTKIPLRQEPGLALPAEGYNALRRRIETQRPAEVPPGKVKLSFLVHPDGTVSDFVFRGRPDQATMDYIGGTIANGSTWKIVRGEEAVRVYFKVILE